MVTHRKNTEANIKKIDTTMENTFYMSTATGNFQRIQFQTNSISLCKDIIEPATNWAFIDMQNMYKVIQKSGWKIHWKLFLQYLEKEYNVTKAVVFMGYIKENKDFYCFLEKAGFSLELRKVIRLKDGTIEGGNVDADLASYVMDHKNEYLKAIIIADDGDYCNTIKSLIKQNKLEKIISSHTIKKTSYLIKEVALKSIISIESLKHIIEYK